MKRNKGFTLIELLIVIALLGILIVGLLAAVDPFEQLKKGRDTAAKNTAAEFYSGLIRYYGTTNQMPWGTATFSVPIVGTNTTIQNAISMLASAGELKARFGELSSTQMSKIYISSPTTSDIRICFDPDSKNGDLDDNAVYNASGVTTSGCKAQTTATGATNCYWCVL